jgi:hypothetical protein
VDSQKEKNLNKEEGSSYTLRKGKSLDYALHRITLAQNFEVEKDISFLSSKDAQLAMFLLLRSFRSKNRSSKNVFYDSYEALGKKFIDYVSVNFDNVVYPDGDSIEESLEKIKRLGIINCEVRNRRYSDGRLGPMGVAINIKVIKTAKCDIRKLIDNL